MRREPVGSAREQDKWLERLLRRRAGSRAAAAGSDGCLDAQTLAAWADGALSRHELAAAEVHASNCSRCLAALAAMERTAPEVAVSRSRGLSLRWLVPLAAAATALAIWVAIPEQRVMPVARESAPASAPERPQAAREPLPAPAQPPSTAAPQSQAEFQTQSQAPTQSKTHPAPPGRVDTLTAPARPASNAAPDAPAAAPVPPAAADAFTDGAAATAQRRGLSRSAVIEAASADPLVRWRVLAGTAIERSTDAGKTWIKTANPSSPADRIVAIRAEGALGAGVTTAGGRTFSTTDGGAIWTPVQENPPAPF